MTEQIPSTLELRPWHVSKTGSNHFSICDVGGEVIAEIRTTANKHQYAHILASAPQSLQMLTMFALAAEATGNIPDSQITQAQKHVNHALTGEKYA